MQEMSTLLQDAQRFSFAASEVRDVVDLDGNVTQLELDHRSWLERPNRVRREVTLGDDSALLIYNDGLLDVHTTRQNFFAQTEIPKTIDEGLDYLSRRLDMRAPIADLFYSSPYDAYIGDSTSGQYVGEEMVEGTRCHHLAFKDPAIDFEFWLEDGERPLPCKLILSYKLDEGAPKSVLTFRDWDLSPEFAADLFTYRPPEGYTRIPFVGLAGDAAAATVEEPSGTGTR